jgi:hypothetical protein
VVTSPAKSVNAVSTCTGDGTAADILLRAVPGRKSVSERPAPDGDGRIAPHA